MAQDERDQEDGDNHRGHHQLHDRLDDGGGAPITIDSLDLRNYVNAYHNADGTFTALQIEQVTGFELNGTAVDVPGFGTQFGLYFLLDGTGHMEGAGQTFDTLRIALMVDPGNNDGALSSTALGGVGFANGTAGDFALATGTLVSATVTFGADGSAHPNFLEQIDPTRIGAKIF